MQYLPITLIACVTLVACQQSETAEALVQPGAADPGSARMAEAVVKGGRAVEIDNDLLNFDYSYPQAVDAIPKLKAWFDADIDTRRQALEEEATEGRRAAGTEGFPYHPYGQWIAWRVVTELPDWLSLSADMSDYTGGAHPNHGFDAMLWDKSAHIRRDPLDLFTSPQALSAALRADFCYLLDLQRAKKRGERLDPARGGMFEECIDPVDSTVILGSSNRRTFNRIGVLVAPYQAGPYVEGDYEVTLPVTEKLLATVKPEYRRYFAASH